MAAFIDAIPGGPTEQAICCLANLQHHRRDPRRLPGFQASSAQFRGSEHTGCIRKPSDLGSILKSVETTIGIAAQDDRVGRIERKHTTCKAMLDPGNRHAANLTGNMHLTS